MAKKNTETKIIFSCNHCNATKYCPDCNVGYKGEENFCGKCGKPLTSMEELEGQDCPICKEKRGLVNSKKVTKKTILPRFTGEEGIRPRFRGLKMISHCTCGNYRPKSKRGLIDTDCANCGGAAPLVILR